MADLIAGAKACLSLRTLCGLDVAPLRRSEIGVKRVFQQEQLSATALRFLAVNVERSDWRTLMLNNGRGWSLESAQELGKAVAFVASNKAQSITTLSLRGSRLTSDAAVALGLQLARSKTLRFISLGPWRSADVLPLDRKERKRYLRNRRRRQPLPNKFDTDESDALAHGQLLRYAVANARVLTQVECLGDDWPIVATDDDATVTALAEAFAKHAMLVKITLNHCPVAPPPEAARPAAAAATPAASGAAAAPAGAPAPVPVAAPPATTDADDGSRGPHFLARTLETSTTLRCLDLAYCGITDTQAHSLLRALDQGRASSVLVELNLAGNRLTDNLITESVRSRTASLPINVQAGMSANRTLRMRNASPLGYAAAVCLRSKVYPNFGLRWFNLADNPGITVYAPPGAGGGRGEGARARMQLTIDDPSLAGCARGRSLARPTTVSA